MRTDKGNGGTTVGRNFIADENFSIPRTQASSTRSLVADVRMVSNGNQASLTLKS